MRQDDSKSLRICCILLKEDLGRIEQFLAVLQINSYQYETFFPETMEYDKQIIQEFGLAVFFASQKSIQVESIFRTLRLMLDNQKDILTVYLDNCILSTGMHMLLDPYQAIFPSEDEDGMITTFSNSLATMVSCQREKKKPKRYVWKYVVILALAITGLLSAILIHQLFYSQKGKNQAITKEEYASWLDTTSDPSEFVEAFFDMVRIGEDGTYQNLWDRFVAQKVKNSGCITEDQWISRWQILKEQNYTIISRRIVSEEENPDQSTYRVFVDLRFQLNGTEDRRTVEITVIKENGVCKYLDGEPVSTSYLISDTESPSEELAV